jgi:hypothetical protein
MVNGDRNRKLLVRSAFVTGTTLAVLMGAQNLAMLDARQVEAFNPDNSVLATPEVNTAVATLAPASMVIAAEQQSPALAVTIVQVAPSITILRQAGDPNTATGNLSGQIVIQPPAAELMATPAPLIVQSQAQPQVIYLQSNQPARQSTNSSR